MKVADILKCFRRGFHGIAIQRAVQMKIDKASRQVISVQIDNVLSTRRRMLANFRDFSFLNNELKPIANSIGKNQTRVTNDHSPNAQCSLFSVQRQSK